MRIEAVRLYRYSLPLVRPIAFGSEALSTRDGVILSVTDDAGQSGLGECAPLPGYSSESLVASMIALRALADRVQDKRLSSDKALEQAQEVAAGLDVPSSAMFALESALLMLSARHPGKTVASLLSSRHSDTVEINALIESDDQLEARVAEVIAKGARAVKLKVGRQAVADDIALARRIRQLLPRSIRLRLDANRAWSLADAVVFADGVFQGDIEYIEEPVRDSAQLAELNNRAPQVPLAIDESVRFWSLEQIRSAGYLKAVVLKPTVIGGIGRTVLLARACRESGKTPVISSSIESSIGLSMLAHLSAALTPDTPSGLDTARLLADDLVTPRFPSGMFRINLGELNGSHETINHPLLEETPLE